MKLTNTYIKSPLIEIEVRSYRDLPEKEVVISIHHKKGLLNNYFVTKESLLSFIEKSLFHEFWLRNKENILKLILEENI